LDSVSLKMNVPCLTEKTTTTQEQCGIKTR